MAEPRKEKPSKESKAFLLDRRGRVFDLDDDAPPPAPAKPKKLADDFPRYRGMNQPDGFFGPVEHDEFGIYGDDDEERDSAFWGGDEEAEDDPLHVVAQRLLPDRPEINLALNLVERLDITHLVAAGLIEEEMRGRLPDEMADALTAAALVANAEGFDDMAAHLSPETVSLVDEFMAAVTAGPVEMPFPGLDMQTQRLIVAMTAADLEVLHKGMKNGGILPPPDEDLEMMGDFLADASRSAASKPTAADVRLMNRAVTTFNAVSHDLPLDVKLCRAGDLGFDLVHKDDLNNAHKDGPEPPAARQKSAKMKSPPKPPRH